MDRMANRHTCHSNCRKHRHHQPVVTPMARPRATGHRQRRPGAPQKLQVHPARRAGIYRKSRGAYFYDVDGRQFIDYLMGYGPIVLGHATNASPTRSAINSAVGPLSLESARHRISRTALSAFPALSGQHFWSVVRLPLPPRCAVPASSPAVNASCAAAIMAGLTGVSPAMPAPRQARPRSDLPCMIWRHCAIPSSSIATLSPVYSRSLPGDGPQDYAEGVRALCDEFGVIFIVDEVKTSFVLA